MALAYLAGSAPLLDLDWDSEEVAPSAEMHPDGLGAHDGIWGGAKWLRSGNVIPRYAPIKPKSPSYLAPIKNPTPPIINPEEVGNLSQDEKNAKIIEYLYLNSRWGQTLSIYEHALKIATTMCEHSKAEKVAREWTFGGQSEAGELITQQVWIEAKCKEFGLA